jgi:cytochrome d ubiquinol oxidase subunit II
MELQTIWFLLWGLLWAVFFITDGFDFGVGTLLPFLGKTDMDRKIMLNAVGPLWDGNEVWLITAGGVTFAAFPTVYAVMFSSLYSALMLILFALILRGVSFEFRGKVESTVWKKFWDTCHFWGSALPALLFGVAFANIFRGIPIDQNGIFQGGLVTLLNSYGLLGGLLFLFMFIQHGALWLCVKTGNDLQERSRKTALIMWPLVLLTVSGFLVHSWFSTDLFRNYLENPILFVVLPLTVAFLLAAGYFLKKAAYVAAWAASAGFIAGTTFFGIIGLYPRLIPSSIDPAYSLTAFNASSSPLTLTIMLAVVIVFIPVVIGYQAWAYRLFSHRISSIEDLDPEHSY